MISAEEEEERTLDKECKHLLLSYIPLYQWEKYTSSEQILIIKVMKEVYKMGHRDGRREGDIDFYGRNENANRESRNDS